MQILIIAIFIAFFVFDVAVELLNLSSLSLVVPKSFQKIYDPKKYKKSQKYLKETTIFGLIESGISLLLLIIFISISGFGIIDNWARSIIGDGTLRGLLFMGILTLLNEIISLPFTIYKTFKIEQKYGFNKTTMQTFILDEIKKLVLMSIIGGIVVSALVFFFSYFNQNAWIVAWIFVALFELFITFIAPVVIMPLFNKFTPLSNQKLKTEIEKFAKKEHFALGGIFVMDASKRSTKSNAFFTGFGKFRRIVFFDTLLKNHTNEEIVSVLAHEIGHYKKKHVVKLIVVSLILSGLFLYFVQLAMNNISLFQAFGLDHISVYAGLLIVGLLIAPANAIISILVNAMSRRHEYEADAFAVQEYGEKKAFVSALQKLSVDNLSNLTPHPLKVMVDYTHPPVLQRIKAINSLS